jgi:hypothetical protein
MRVKSEDEGVVVRDRKNPERVLGRLNHRPCALRGAYVEMAIMPRMTARMWVDPPAPDEPVECLRARFEVSYRTTDGGYTKHAEFLTDTPLGVLQMLQTFRLPGESEEQAHYRLRFSDY